jgi:hypothetical protein
VDEELGNQISPSNDFITLSKVKSKQDMRMAEIAAITHKLNIYCQAHPDLSTLMLPLRDGLTVMTYKKNSNKK